MTNGTIPASWSNAVLEDTSQIVRGIAFPSDAKSMNPQPHYIACLRTANVQKNVRWSDLWFVPRTFVKNDAQNVRQNDILISIANSFNLVGKVAQVKRVETPSTLGAFIALIRPSTHLNPQYLFHFLASSEVQIAIRAMASTTTNISNVSTSKLAQLAVSIPPLAEQARIVEAIETQFSRLDAAVAGLERARANLKRYRAAVLNAACSGRLVPSGANRDQRAVARDPDSEGLPFQIPEHWDVAKLVNISTIKGGVTKGQKHSTNIQLTSVPYLRVANVQRGYLDLSEVKSIEVTSKDLHDMKLKFGDVLFTEGGDRDKLGRGWVWQEELTECIHQNHVFRARLNFANMNPKFVSWYGNSYGQKFFLDRGKQTTNLASINMRMLGSLPIPMPPIDEQHRIVAEVERRLSVVDQMEASIAAGLKRAERLRQSILHKAFTGQLVPQEPADEPAAALLARVRAARVAAPPPAKRPRASS